MNKSMRHRHYIYVIFLLILKCQHVHAGAPLFSKYPVSSAYKGGNHRLLENDTGFFEIDWTRKQAINEKPNFAGHYVVYTFNCGTGAMCGEILNIKTGMVAAKLPYPYISENLTINTKIDSALMIVSGIPLDQDDKKIRREYYLISKNGLKKITASGSGYSR